ncbi:unnamed protein product [Hydatigera taeniaeformis]|uniref:BHLH domain-containing protein n=1 Tax=Hydatigena taeniaeformis TaxID=6205 RepID=A0A0R3WSN0_HYDTA|nr:unnamed protein product [Hydatigera taeniaeformis]
MDFSTNVGETGVFTNSSAHQQFQAKMFSSMDYSPTTAATAAAAISMGQHRCFVEEMSYSTDNGSGSSNSSGSNVAEAKRPSYQPNGGSIKAASGDLLRTAMPSVGRGYGAIMDGQEGYVPTSGGGRRERRDADSDGGLSHVSKRGKCPKGTSEDSSARSSSMIGGQMTFQELTTMHGKPMDFAIRGQTSQVSLILSL